MREHDDRRGGGGSDVPRLFVAVPVPADVGLEVGRVIGETRAALGEDGQQDVIAAARGIGIAADQAQDERHGGGEGGARGFGIGVPAR